jgi:hypothetical protein
VELMWGIVIVVLGLLAWGGQAVSWFAPQAAARLGLAEPEDTVEGVFWADGRGEALWDIVTLWTLPLAGLLLIVGHEAWTWLGLVGGGMYVYFGGRGILTRMEMQRRDYRIGTPASVRVGLLALGVWTVAGAVTIAAAVVELA